MESQIEQLEYLESLAFRVLEDLNDYSEKTKELLTNEEQKDLLKQVQSLSLQAGTLSPDDTIAYINLLDSIRQLVEVKDELVKAILGEGYLEGIKRKKDIGTARALKNIFASESLNQINQVERIRNNTPKITTYFRNLLKKLNN